MSGLLPGTVGVRPALSFGLGIRVSLVVIGHSYALKCLQRVHRFFVPIYPHGPQELLRAVYLAAGPARHPRNIQPALSAGLSQNLRCTLSNTPRKRKPDGESMRVRA